MPRLPINYENACIYEIVCKDVNITQRYIGSTTNLINRRNNHKSDCNNEKRKQYNYYVYQFIRDNGGIVNWNIVLIEQVIDCKDKEHLHKRERFYIEDKKAELNKSIPLRTHKEYREDNREKKKEYYEENKEKTIEKVKEYREKNKDKINEKVKEYYENNKNKIAEKHKIHYENNKNEINEKQRINRANKKNLN